jgi:hypothetical protein
MGYMFNSSTIIDAGMWFLKTWKKNINYNKYFENYNYI